MGVLKVTIIQPQPPCVLTLTRLLPPPISSSLSSFWQLCTRHGRNLPQVTLPVTHSPSPGAQSSGQWPLVSKEGHRPPHPPGNLNLKGVGRGRPSGQSPDSTGWTREDELHLAPGRTEPCPESSREGSGCWPGTPGGLQTAAWGVKDEFIGFLVF